MDLAETCCSGRLAITLEGGYHLGGLRESVKAVLKELLQESLLTQGDMEALEQGSTTPIVKEVKETQKPYWPTLQTP
jgi:acetoin utilization deacetylase AcuC-like enzyme